MNFSFENIPIFAGLDPESISFLKNIAKLQTFKKGELLIKQGDEGNTFFILESGKVEIILQQIPYKEAILASLGPMSCFGEMALIECMRRSATVRAVEAGRTYILSSADLYHLFKKTPDQYAIVILNIARDLCRRIRELNQIFIALTH